MRFHDIQHLSETFHLPLTSICLLVNEQTILYYDIENTANPNTGKPLLYTVVLHLTFPLCAMHILQYVNRQCIFYGMA